MISRVIAWSVHNRLPVLLASALVTLAGIQAARTLPLDAIPDLSDVQVIVRTTFPGQAPQVVEDQVTYPMTTTLLSVPRAKTVRGYSFFGDSFVYVLFEDGTDPYWARSRVLEYLSQVQGRLPPAAKASLGPDATGVGWIYEYALVDRSGRHDIAQLRALQDWFLRYELKTVPDVAEVATLGGYNTQYQIQLDPDRLRALGVSLDTVLEAVRAANGETGGAVLELAEAEYMVRTRGYLADLDDFRAIPLRATKDAGRPILLGDVAVIAKGPEIRRGLAELNGEGEVVGGVIVLRSGRNAMATLTAVKAKLESLKAGLPAGVEIITTYDRSALIERAVKNLGGKLVEELLVVALVCAAFLFHLRSSLVAVLTLPVGILAAFLVMRWQGINADIMSLGGIAIAIGAMVDAAVVMIENAHKKLEAWHHANNGNAPDDRQHVQLMLTAAREVGPALFFSLLVIMMSFVPVFALTGQEGRLFSPLAYTKTYAMAAAAGLSITLIPVLMVYFVRGRIRGEHENPLTRALIAGYRPVIETALVWPRLTLLITLLLLMATLVPILKLGSEFMPPLDEGDLLYMPTTLPGLSAAKAAEIVQQVDRTLKAFPEVDTVFGKMGRADTATDPAPLEMMETTVHLKPQDQWRPGMTREKLVAEMDAAMKIPGMGNVWVQPIRNRIDMLATGIKSPVGIKVAGPDLAEIDRITAQVEGVIRQVPGTSSALAERAVGGRYIEVVPDRLAAARYGISVADIQQIVAFAIGGENIGETVEGLARFPINVRYQRDWRDSVEDLRNLPFLTRNGATLTLGQIATVTVTEGPAAIRSENARPNGWIYIDIRDRDLGSWVTDAQKAVTKTVSLPAGYSVGWSGQYEYLERARDTLSKVIPIVLAIILLLLYLAFRNLASAILIMCTLPFALAGGFWLVWFLGHSLSVASAIGFIALAGVAAEFGVVMLLYLNMSVQQREARGEMNSLADLRAAVIEGAVMRVRPKAMTAVVIVGGLLPLFFGTGTGSEIMQRIAAPMIGGMITAPLLSMVVIPAIYYSYFSLFSGKRFISRTES